MIALYSVIIGISPEDFKKTWDGHFKGKYTLSDHYIIIEGKDLSFLLSRSSDGCGGEDEDVKGVDPGLPFTCLDLITPYYFPIDVQCEIHELLDKYKRFMAEL